jgi:hypothetical protein
MGANVSSSTDDIIARSTIEQDINMHVTSRCADLARQLIVAVATERDSECASVSSSIQIKVDVENNGEFVVSAVPLHRCLIEQAAQCIIAASTKNDLGCAGRSNFISGVGPELLRRF